MTGFKEYFRSHLKSNLKAIIYILAAVLIITFLVGNRAQPTSEYDYTTHETLPDYYSTLYIPVTFMCILAYVLPVMEFSFFKKRINLDCAYALPISRRAMGLVHYLSGLAILLGVFSVSYLLNFISLLCRAEYFYFAPMIGHYFLCLLLGAALYSFMAFVFNQANTRGDGIWFMVLYSLALMLGIAALDVHIDVGILNSYNCIPWGVIDTLTTNVQYVVEKEIYASGPYFAETENIFWFIFWVVVGIASAAGLLISFGKRRMEKTEEISDSYFGFRVLIPWFAVTGMITFRSADIFIFWVIIELIALLGYTIYRRGFHYKLGDILVLVGLMLFIFI